MREKLSFQIKARFTESEMKWLRSQSEELGVEISNIVRFSVRKMRLEGGVIHITLQKENYPQPLKIKRHNERKSN